jgi:cytochrome c peroxidase
MSRAAGLLVLALLAGCPRAADHTASQDRTTKHDASATTPGDGGISELPPAPPLPTLPLGLPPVQLPTFVTPDSVALGAALFSDVRLSTSGKLACATCHNPARDYSGVAAQPTALGKRNARRTPSLANLAWKRELGWDGRYGSFDDFMQAHVPGQLGQPLEAALHGVADDRVVQAELARVGGAPQDAAARALAAFALTRYEGDSPWDRAERSGDPPPDLAAGYKLFMGKARCAGCHPPPLYTDLGYHHIVRNFTPADKGRGFVEPSKTDAFATPTLRGAALRFAYFHSGIGHGDPLTLEAGDIDVAIAQYVNIAPAADADPGRDPLLDKPIVLSDAELQQLVAFVTALTRREP